VDSRLDPLKSKKRESGLDKARLLAVKRLTFNPRLFRFTPHG
jgi:hypothetical protein